MIYYRTFRQVLDQCLAYLPELDDRIGIDGLTVADCYQRAATAETPDSILLPLITTQYRYLCPLMGWKASGAFVEPMLIDDTTRLLILHAAALLRLRYFPLRQGQGRFPVRLPTFEQVFAHAADLHERKDHDYANGKPYANFFISRLFGLEPDIAIMVRLSDKYQRLTALVDMASRGERARVDESIDDTLLDLLNYAGILTVISDMLTLESPAEKAAQMPSLNQLRLLRDQINMVQERSHG